MMVILFRVARRLNLTPVAVMGSGKLSCPILAPPSPSPVPPALIPTDKSPAVTVEQVGGGADTLEKDWEMSEQDINPTTQAKTG